jgi:hypothetical protein
MARKAIRGQWVQVHRIVLAAGTRAPQIPPETQAVPLEMWVKGFLTTGSATEGEEVTIETVTGRRLTGRLVDAQPQYRHGFGEPVPELLTIGRECREIVERAREDRQ